ncbi:hypothetical protein A6V39_03250 [Candidatus Mycoplasma haematobovis]|uniref:Uncharacterized protein n=1 Tax=Candidatus Mycoplasma haematobovis TaxID=432608 RepID=A0A1A9QD15_9MOLU|nr:hypothetical protein [Candidatus Mycoplasma haematobovis]OAL09901.1 hypothetical protein A6V39_03250 [Candidatus Mycoplasma haematobovis]
MNLLTKVGLGVGSLASVGGLGYGIYHNITTSTYSKLFKDTLLTTTSETHKTNWEARLVSLKVADKNTLVDELGALKDKNTNATWIELRDWCNSNINNVVNKEDSKEYQNIQNYCTFSIKEQITNAIDEGKDEKWEVALQNLKKINENTELDQELITAKGKELNSGGKEAVKDWCSKAYKKPYKGPKDQDFKNALRICVAPA